MALHCKNINLGCTHSPARRPVCSQPSSRLIDVQTATKFEEHTAVEYQIAVVQVGLAPKRQRYTEVLEQVARGAADSPVLVADSIDELKPSHDINRLRACCLGYV